MVKSLKASELFSQAQQELLLDANREYSTCVIGALIHDLAGGEYFSPQLLC